MVGWIVAIWTGKMDVTRVGEKAESVVEGMVVMRAGDMVAEWQRAGLSKMVGRGAGLRGWL